LSSRKTPQGGNIILIFASGGPSASSGQAATAPNAKLLILEAAIGSTGSPQGGNIILISHLEAAMRHIQSYAALRAK
jgi:hypothetical protein